MFRRQLFQVVRRDVRVRARTAPSQSTSQPSTQSPAAMDGAQDWEIFLEQACQAAFLAQYCEAARDAAVQLGVALRSEVVEIGDDIASHVGMRPLERRRFIAQLQS